MKKVLVLSFILAFSLVFIAHAQLPTSIDGVDIDSSITNPRPGQSVDISIESYLFDLNSASIVWIVDGKTHTSGVGIKKITITAPQIGISTNISANIKAVDGREVKKSITIRSSSVDIIWESGGYSHPLYVGKTNFTYQNSIRLIAIPHLSKDGKSELDPKTLVYTWKRDGKYIENGQGYGVMSVEIPADDLPKDLNITVDINNREQTLNTSGSIILTPGDPSIIFYEDSPLYGIFFNKALRDNVQLKNKEMEILAVPFGFTNNNQNTYLWSINNIEQSNLLKNRSITIRAKEGTEGNSNINLDIRNQENILQGSRNGFSIYFNKNL